MSDSQRWPKEGQETPAQGDEPFVVHPDAILVDQKPETHAHFQSSDEKESEGEEDGRSPFSMRLFCFLGLIFCLFFGLGLVVWSGIGLALAGLLLFQNHDLNRSVRRLWKLCANTLVVGLGFALGVLSPTLGLGLLVLYFSLSGEVIDNTVLRKVMRSAFNQL